MLSVANKYFMLSVVMLNVLDILQNDTQNIDTHHTDIQHNGNRNNDAHHTDIQHNDTQHNNI
jgi:hypothetical protein